MNRLDLPPLEIVIRARVLVLVLTLLPSLPRAEEMVLSSQVRGENATSFFEIEGTGDRQNPVRFALGEPYTGKTLFVRFRLRYRADSIDTATDGDGEFFVFWLDRQEGGEASTHSGGVPNIGIHVDPSGANRFMVRYSSAGEVFGPVLEGDREYVILAKLEKKTESKDAPFSSLSLWVDPGEGEPDSPDAAVHDDKAPSRITWLGFSTARKTEPGDRILVGDVRLNSEREPLFSKPPLPLLTEIPPPPDYAVPPAPREIAEVDPPPDTSRTSHWSFLPLSVRDIPAPRNGEWVRTPVDAFIAEGHERAGLTPAPPAPESALTRRLSLVLTGLPPERIVPRDQLDAYAGELLDSRAYGERWGRHWLDVARWAESNGHQHNRPREHAWRYRDWVIDSFATHKPYDRFLQEQIAGDEIEPFHPDHLVATGFLAAARYSGNELDKAIQRNDILVDITNTTAKAFLGLTMECAQCHDHFFDPISQWDYYHLMAYFAQGQPGDVILQESGPELEQLIEDRWGLFESVRSRMIERKRAAGIPEPVLVIPKSVPGAMTAAEKQAFAGIESRIASLPRAWAYYSPVTSPHSLEFAPTAIRWPLPFQKESLETVRVRYLDRGNVETPGPVAPPRWPRVFGNPEGSVPGTRTGLARWMTDPGHPLTARVWVNRIWQWYFGRGLVETSGDFGVAGAEPSHPALLDYLASELIRSDWNTRHIHELILQSNTFRQGSQGNVDGETKDPANILLSRWVPRRLEAEAIRDSFLSVSGSLEESAGGPAVPLAKAEDSKKRSLYLEQKRDNLPHQQMLFDSADAITSCAKRRVSTVSLQPLWMMNNPFVEETAAILASRWENEFEEGNFPSSAIRELFQQLLLRQPSEDELRTLEDLATRERLHDAVVVLLNLNEFTYIP